MKKMQTLLVIFICIGSINAFADDIDMLVQDRSPMGVPYLHVVLDSSSTAFQPLCNYGLDDSCAPPFMSQQAYANLRPGHRAGEPVTRFEVFSAVLASLFGQPGFGSLHVALLMSDRDSGARVLSVYRQLGGKYEGISGARMLIAAMASVAVEANPAQAHHFQAKDAFYIWYRYINGDTPEAFDFDSCSRFYSVVMATESSFEDSSVNPDFVRSLAMSPVPGMGFTDVLARMRNKSTDLVTGSPTQNNNLEKTWLVTPGTGGALVTQWARAGGGGAPLTLDDPALLEESLGFAFSQAVSGSHVSVIPRAGVTSLTADLPTRDAFLGLVEPGPTIRWRGNLKKYKLGSAVFSGSIDSAGIVDKNAISAIVPGGDYKGLIASDTLSFWTETRFLPLDQNEDALPGVDGRVVSRGGAGQKIPGFFDDSIHSIGRGNNERNSRQVFAEPGSITNGSNNTLLPLNVEDGNTVANLAARLGVSSPTDAEELILWARGQDVDDEDADGNIAEARPWIMGSVLHSKAVSLNYGAVAGYSAENPNIRVFLGTGDGIFHAFENTSVAGAESGREVFAFYPGESLGNIPVWRENTIASTKMRYGVDGGISVLRVDNNGDGNLNYRSPDSDEAYIFFGMRRGGYSYYALDVSDPSAPPVLKWKISRSGVGGDDFPELGLTFSRPIVGKVKFGEYPLDVLIFAGGYNGGWAPGYQQRVGKDLNAAPDVEAISGVSTGNAIFIVNARTGELVWKAVYGSVTDSVSSSRNTRFRHAEMLDSIPSTVSPLKTGSGIIDRLYVGDTGGVLWRVDLPVASGPPNPDHRKQHWFVSKLAELGGQGEPADRRFFHGPDIVRSKNYNGTPFDGVLISSGDRAHPNSTGVINYHFYIKDFLVTSGDDAARDRPAIVISDDVADTAIPDRANCSGDAVVDTAPDCILPMENGWMLKLARPGEKSLSSPLVDGGRVFFTSYVPPEPRACSISQGQSYAYIVKLKDGSAVHNGQRIFPLGSGSTSAVLALGDKLLFPLGGAGDVGQGACEGNLCQSNSDKLYKLYWRDPGVDEF